MAQAIWTVIGVILVYFSQYVLNFIRNVINSWNSGLPLVVVPVDPAQIFWFILAPGQRKRLKRILPKAIWERLALTIFGWEFHEKMRPFERHAAGKTSHETRSYILVGMGQLELWTADPVAVQDILSRPRDFEVPRSLEPVLAQYGHNVMTTNGDQWARHRRIVSSIMDERISKTIFHESSSQANGCVEEMGMHLPMVEHEFAETRHLFDMLKKITINVLFSAGMGKNIAWRDQRHGEAGQVTEIESLITVVTSMVGLGLLPTEILVRWPRWLPGHETATRIGRAKIDVLRWSQAMLEQERAIRATGEIRGPASNMMSKLLEASQGGRDSGRPLTETELISNLFILTAAGFETTATLLAFAVVLLARHAKWQDWVLEEVDHLLPAGLGQKPPEYTSVFPRATRIMAFMFETLRLYGPVGHVHRETREAQVLQTAKGPIRIAANTKVYINSVALHLIPTWRDLNRSSDPAFYEESGADEAAFRPSRWINTPGSTHTFHHPARGTWVPWAMGPRVCPGQKMAQVEFVAVMLALLRRNRIEAAPLEGESRRQVEMRLDARLRDSQWVTVLQMNDVFDARPGRGLAMRVCRRRIFAEKEGVSESPTSEAHLPRVLGSDVEPN